MKRIIVSLMILAAIAGVASAATTGSIVLSGTVTSILSITVTSSGAGSGLDLTTDQSNVNVGTVVEYSNLVVGYTVKITSANAKAAGVNDARFEGADGANPDTLDYTVSYGGVPVTFSAGVATVTDSTGKTPLAGSSNDVLISFSGSGANLRADSYGDTLTFDIASK